jgi:hypothetical protein
VAKRDETPLYVGTSGWSYDDRRGRFYPRDVPRKNWLRWYAENFSAAEINGSFYRTPSLEAVRAWREQNPEGLHLLVESIEIHHSLEATPTHGTKLARSLGDTACSTGAQVRTGAVSAACAV